MPRFESYDGTTLAYHETGDGPPLLCVPGGPGRDATYLGDLGGLTSRRTLVLLDNRGTGESGAPDDSATYRVDRLVDDVEAWRRHLDLERIDLLGHSAGGGVAVLYAARYPERVRRLVLVTPGLRAVGLPPLGMAQAQAARSGEPWYADAKAAADSFTEHTTFEELALLRPRLVPFAYGRWDDNARRHSEAGNRSRAAAEGYDAGFTPDPDAARAALAKLEAPALVVVGGLDFAPTPEAARPLVDWLPYGEMCVLDDAGHNPWVDVPDAFAAVVNGFLSRPVP